MLNCRFIQFLKPTFDLSWWSGQSKWHHNTTLHDNIKTAWPIDSTRWHSGLNTRGSHKFFGRAYFGTMWLVTKMKTLSVAYAIKNNKLTYMAWDIAYFCVWRNWKHPLEFLIVWLNKRCMLASAEFPLCKLGLMRCKWGCHMQMRFSYACETFTIPINCTIGL